jgi:capsular exopolysaccharide synthesis family protein
MNDRRLNVELRSPGAAGLQELDIGWLLSVLRQQRWWIIGPAVLGLVLAKIYLATTPPGYTSSAVLMLETQSPGLFRPNSVFSERVIDNAMVESQVEMLRSSRIVSDAIRALKLTEDPGFATPPEAVPAEEEGWWAGLTGWFAGLFASPPTPEEQAAEAAAQKSMEELQRAEQQNSIVAEFIDALTISRIGSSNAILLSFEADDPIKAANIVNQLVDSYISSQLAVPPPEGARNTLVYDRIVITKATPSTSPSSPKRNVAYGGGLLLGLIAGFALAFWREWIDDTIRTPERLEQLADVPCLSVVPRIHSLRTPKETPPLLVPSEGDAEGNYHVFNADAVPTMTDSIGFPSSPFADAIRRIAVASREFGEGRSRSVIGITSANEGEGKSTIAADIALVMARTSGPTLLIDCDFRNRTLTKRLAPTAIEGLAEVIQGKASLTAVTWNELASPLQFIPAISNSTHGHPADLLSSPAFEALLAKPGRQIKHIVLDFPALYPMVDVRSVAHVVDDFLLVVEWGKTSVRAITTALEASGPVQAKIGGTVLNKVNLSKLSSAG